MQINSIIKSNKYNMDEELKNRHKNKYSRKGSSQVKSFSDVLEQINKNSEGSDRKQH